MCTVLTINSMRSFDVLLLFIYSQKLVKEQNLTFSTPPVIQNFLSAFLLWLLRAVMVLLVVKSCFIEAHWSKLVKHTHTHTVTYNIVTFSDQPERRVF